LTNDEAKKDYFISEEEVLDFLTHWLKEESNANLFVLYARTRQRL